ncbi:autophagy-related protein 13 homolog isoform X2 [Culicoides brevitarsis]|uniref:autophagy-related protein 13 homolog isoform X2 n=1 Tax=Culicoides brevitarsis TaxID=469753 RepID=UPI00307BA4CD
MSNKLNASELKDIDKFIKFLIIKATQVIVQSRLGSKIRTEHNSSGNDWFNIAICDHQDVLSETRKALNLSSKAGEGYKQVRVGQLAVPLGTLNMAVAYRTTNQMTITPTQTIGRDSTTLILKSSDPHWNLHQDLSPAHRYQNYGGSKKSEKKIIDIDKPMRCGAFVDVSSAKQYTEADFSLPETPPFSWLLRKPSTTTAPSASSPSSSTTTSQNHKESDETSQKQGTSPSHQSTATTTSRWRTLPAAEDEKLFKELHFPFATQNTPISDLAKFYRECFNAPPLQFAELDNSPTSTVDVVDGSSGANNSATDAAAATETIERCSSINDLTKQLEQFETSLGDYDKLVTSLCQQNTEVDSNSNS